MSSNVSLITRIEDLPLPSESTSARPGSLEKIELMRTRVESEHHLYHPDDETMAERRRNGSTHFPRRGGQT